jgi:hypothetical protein
MPRPRTVIVKTLYWLAVLVISLALLVLLVLFFESRDSSDLENSRDSTDPGTVIIGRS